MLRHSALGCWIESTGEGLQQAMVGFLNFTFLMYSVTSAKGLVFMNNFVGSGFAARRLHCRDGHLTCIVQGVRSVPSAACSGHYTRELWHGTPWEG